MKTKTLVPIILLLVFFSCKKNDNKNSNCDKTMASIAGTYSIIKVEFGINGVFQDATNLLDDCELDDKLSLNNNGTTAYNDLGTVCSPSGSTTGTWNISSANKFTINDNSGNFTDISDADITSYDCSTLVLTGSDPSSPSDQFRLTLKK